MRPLVFGMLTGLNSIGFCQIQCKFDVDKKDTFSGDRVVMTKSYTIGKFENLNKNLFASVGAADGNYFMRVYSTVDMGCASSRSKISLKTTGNQIVELTHLGDVDCGKHTSAYSSIPPTVLVHLADTLQDKDYSMLRIQFEKWANIVLDRPTIIKELCDCVDSALKTNGHITGHSR